MAPLFSLSPNIGSSHTMNARLPLWMTWTGLIAAIVMLAGCGGPPGNNPMLDDARATFASAAEDSLIAARAPVALQEAEEDLHRSEQLFRAGADPEEVSHYAYLAQQRVRIAEESARLKQAEASIQRAEAERREVQLEARTVEARRAEQQARSAQQAAQQERRRAEELARQVEDLEARQTERGLVLTLGDVLFNTGRSELLSGGQLAVERLATFMKNYPKRNVLIEGHTDITGSEGLNLELSRKRAAAVQQALVERGISSDRIHTRGYASQYPVASNDTAAGRQQNRRVEIVISDAEGKLTYRNE